MALIKREYKDGETLITAENLNDIQDAVIALEDGLFSIDNEKSGEVITITDAAKRGFRSLNIYGKTTQNGTPTPATPIDLVSSVDGDSITIHVCGKNLFTGWIVGGINPDTGELQTTHTQRRTDYLPIFATMQSYSISGMPSTLYNFVAFYDADKKYISRTAAGFFVDRVFTAPTNAKYFMLTVYENAVASGTIAEADAVAKSTLIEANDTKTTYETAKPIQKAVVSIPNGLHGVPVTNGGNYVDANGQRWICDEIDFSRGVYVQRIGSKTFDGSSDEQWYAEAEKEKTSMFRTAIADSVNVGNIVAMDFLCTHLKAGSIYSVDSDGVQHTGVQFYFRLAKSALATADVSGFRAFLANSPMIVSYALATPIETPLSAEDLAAYDKLRTYKDNTTVSNDGLAYMELEYSMDAKKYLDRITGFDGNAVRIANVTLFASAWKGSNSPYSQVVNIDGITANSQVDLTPSVEQLAIFHNKDLAFVTENEDGIVTVYAIGQKPGNDYVIQATITEVAV